MAHILIDGYNLIGTAHGNLEKARSDLIELLLQYSDKKNHEVTLIFDGWKDGKRDETRIKTKKLTVVYSRLGEKADQTIMKKLASSTKPWIVVTSDREIADYAAGKDFAVVTSSDFERKLYSALNEDAHEEHMNDPDDEGDYPARQMKGNARKLSKKEKKRTWALKKL